jgi:hypothetical protein
MAQTNPPLPGVPILDRPATDVFGPGLLPVPTGSGAAATDVNVWAKPQVSTLVPVPYAATITLNRDAVSNHIDIGTLTGNLTLANPTGFTNAVVLNIWLTQDATGSRTLTLGSKIKTAGGAGLTLSTAPNAVDFLALSYNPTKDIWVAALSKGVA